VLFCIKNEDSSKNHLTTLLKMMTCAMNVIQTQELKIENVFNTALAHHKQGNLEPAKSGYAQVLSLIPNHTDSIHLSGVIAMQEGDLETGKNLILQAISQLPNQAMFHTNLAECYFLLKNYNAALEQYDIALKFSSNRIQVLYNKAKVLNELKRYPECIECLNEFLKIEPNNAGALHQLGYAKEQLRQYSEALEYYEKALSIDNTMPDTLNNRGLVLQKLSRLSEAFKSVELAIKIKSDSWLYWNNLGTFYLEIARYQDSIHAFKQSLSLGGDEHFVEKNCALAELTLGNFETGWKLYEHRWFIDFFQQYKREFPQPKWLGQFPISGKRIFIHEEQGAGDNLQFCRYAKLLADQGATVYLETHDAYESLVRSMDPRIHLVKQGEAPDSFDCFIPMLSLPLAFGTTVESIPSFSQYFYIKQDRLKAWKQRLGKHIKPRIGLVWCGYAGHGNDRNRSIRLETLIQNLPQCFEYHSLQKEKREGDELVFQKYNHLNDHADQLLTYEETGALASQMDLIISVDTSVAHLCGALGLETWVLIAHGPDYRWLLNREDSPWYPSIRLFRQPQWNDWNSVATALNNALRQKFSA
jgi:tetratricopeptide (TPR) repeat protein